MRVVAAFDDLTSEEASDLGDAFWLADTPSNRKLAEAAWVAKRHDPNSAIFNRPSGPVGATKVLKLLNDIDLHHPEWREIVFSGAELTPELKTALSERGHVVEHGPRGFVVRR